MSASAAQLKVASSGGSTFWSSLGGRQLQSYPDTPMRSFQLGLAVLTTVIVYYENYISGGVATQILPSLHMSFTYFVVGLALANLAGAFASITAGLADRFGRANLVVYGMLLSSVLVFFALPHAHSELVFVVETCAVGFVEGIVLVATPALVRDFSPQVGRATAMGFWTMGPVLGSLVVSVTATQTLPTVNPDWQGQYQLCGAIGLVVFVLVFVAMRELSPPLRDQLMVTLKERELIEARAKGLDIDSATRKPFAQMLHFDIVVSAIGISVLLLIYYTAVGFGTIYFETVLGFKPNQANGIGNWDWAADAIALLVFGLLSDRLRVRKPFMLAGGIASAVMIVVYLSQATRHPSYYTMALIVSLLAISLACAFAPWMASFTETVEARNPALTATGLAIWGLTIRVVIFGAFIILPHVVSAQTPLVTYGATAQAYEQEPGVKIFLAHEKLFTTLNAAPTAANLAKARTELGPNYLSDITAVTKVKPQLLFLEAHGAALTKAQKDSPGQWQDWYWVCFGGAVVFIPMIWLLKGRWNPKKARQDADAHDLLVRQELAKLRGVPV